MCALPGISFARNYNYRSELDDWLRAVECRKVIVAFDDEDKSGKPLRQRLDAVKYARYLACDLAKKLHVTGLFLQLPKEWRNAKGKADWDGALAMLAGTDENSKLTQPNERLGIPSMREADGPLGVREYGKSTAFPAGVAALC